MITFRGTGSTAQSECSVRFSFLYTGDFNQAVLRAVYLDGAADVPALAIKKAASNAVTWDSADDGTVSVTAVELRSVRGLPVLRLHLLGRLGRLRARLRRERARLRIRRAGNL